MEILKLGDSLKSIVSKINSNFTKCSRQQVIFSGSATIPSNNSGNTAAITTTADITQFDGLIFQREDCNAVAFYIPPASGSQYTYTAALNGCYPVAVMRDGEMCLCDIEVSGTNVIITVDETFAGVIVTV